MPFCQKCGKEITSDTNFCSNCGASVVTTTIPTPSLQTVSLGTRAIAAIIDHIMIFIVALVLRLIIAAIMFPFFWAFRPDVFFGLFGLNWVLWILYFTYFEGSRGQTPAKKWLKIKVVREEGSPIDYGTALVRNILRIIDALPIVYIIGAILIVVTDKKQRLGDIVAKTLVTPA